MVASRRDLLRAGGFALAAGPATAQVYTATSISEAAQQARREVGRLGRRADNLLRQTAADGAGRGNSAVRRALAEEGHLSRELAEVLNRRVSEDDWLLIVPTRELDLVLAMRPLVIRIAPKPDEVEAAVKEPLPQIEPQPDAAAGDVVLAVVLAALGVETAERAAVAPLRDDTALAAALKDTTAAVKARTYGLAALELERLMRLIVLPRNIERLSGGDPTKARMVYRRLVLRFVPFIGWPLFVALLLAAVYQARDTTAPVLR
jgi:hypothetical protein